MTKVVELSTAYFPNSAAMDLTVFGASGFIGQAIVNEAANRSVSSALARPSPHQAAHQPPFPVTHPLSRINLVAEG